MGYTSGRVALVVAALVSSGRGRLRSRLAHSIGAIVRKADRVREALHHASDASVVDAHRRVAGAGSDAGRDRSSAARSIGN